MSVAWKGDYLAIRRRRASGRDWEYVDHPGAVVILPLLQGEPLLIKIYRASLDQTIWELPAGTLEPGEDPLQCAERELLEETGYEAERVTPLQSFYTTPGFCNERIHGFLAEGLVWKGQQLEADEEIEVVPSSWVQVTKWVQEGVIEDAKSLCLLMYYQTFCET